MFWRKERWKKIVSAGTVLTLGAVLSCGFWLLSLLSLWQGLVMAAVLLGIVGLFWSMARQMAPAQPVSKTIERVVDCAFVFLFLRYVGQFAPGQSLALTVVAAYLYFLIVAGKKRYFEPYWISVQPNWYELLRDQGVVNNIEEWRAISAAVNNKPPWKYDVLRSGIRLKFLDSASSFDALIHQPDIPEILFGANFGASIDGKMIYDVLAKLRMPTRVDITDLYVKCGRDGYDIGIARGVELIKLASLPYEEFGYYSINWEELSFRRKERLWEEFLTRRKNILEKNGWKIEPIENVLTELPSGHTYLKHKYFLVFHNELRQSFAVSPFERNAKEMATRFEKPRIASGRQS